MIDPKGFLSEFGCSAKQASTSAFVGAKQRLHRGENYPMPEVGPNKQGYVDQHFSKVPLDDIKRMIREDRR
jgi:hypothetical protein